VQRLQDEKLTRHGRHVMMPGRHDQRCSRPRAKRLNGLQSGLMLFPIAAGLTLVFGLGWT